jgi:dTMP kinase
MFFSFDGVDGVGKSTQIRLFCDWLRELGHDVATCRDPGSTDLGEKLREIVLLGHAIPIDARSEMLLYMAARAQLVAELIRPALDEGRTVVSDRFLLANVVYQGYGGGLDIETLWQVGNVATAGCLPDLTFVLDLDLVQANQRMQGELDRMESKGDAYRERVRQGYLQEANRHADRMVVIDAQHDIETVHRAVRAAAESRLSSS